LRAGTWPEGQENKAELAYLQFVAVRERRGLDALAVQIGAIERADIVGPENAIFVAHLGVAARNRDVVKENIAVGVAPDRHNTTLLPPSNWATLGREHETGPLVGAPGDDQCRAPLRYIAQQVAGVEVALLKLLGREEGDGRYGRRSKVEVSATPLQRGATRGAEIGPRRVAVAAAVAVQGLGLDMLPVVLRRHHRQERLRQGGLDDANPPFPVGVLVHMLGGVHELAVHFDDRAVNRGINI
jgi:hypothetical protein